MKRLWILTPLLILTLILALPQKADAQPRQFPASFSASDLINEVNALRAANGLPAYQVNTILMSIAQQQADYMASIQTVTHYGADGTRPFQRALNAGYPLSGDVALGGFFSENIQAGLNLSAADAVSEWQGDYDHLNTMLSPDLTDAGAGVAVVNNVYYYVLDAGASGNSAPVGGEGTSAPGASTATPYAPATVSSQQPLITSTPEEDGSVYHTVKSNEALWSIALAYDVKVDEIKKLNGLASNDIYVGQKLLIKKPKAADTPTPEPSVTVTLGIPTSTATRPVTPTSTSTVTPIPTPPSSRKSGELVVGGIIVAALLAAGLGAWLSRKKPE